MNIPLEITPTNVAEQLVDKHKKALKVSSEEFDRYQTLENRLDLSAEKHKNQRDKINIEVQKQKELRQTNYSESKDLRKEFTAKAQKKKSMANIPMEVLILTKQIDQFEWEIQTEATNIEGEKKLVKQIQDNIQKLHNYATMYQEHEEVSKAIRQLTSELSNKLNNAENAHQAMLVAVNQSDEHHKSFVDAVMKLRDARTKRVGFQREVDKHKKALDHWQKVFEKENLKIATDKKSKKKGNVLNADKDKDLDTGEKEKDKETEPAPSQTPTTSTPTDEDSPKEKKENSDTNKDDTELKDKPDNQETPETTKDDEPKTDPDPKVDPKPEKTENDQNQEGQ
jgi:uncharacterized coiled-coil DUF342 family protein